MAISDIPILSMLRTRMNWGQERQRVLAENIANADTPGFRPRDLTPPKFDSALGVASSGPAVTLVRTEPGHIAGPDGGGATDFRSQNTKGYEVHPTGNAVSLEDEMMKLAANQMDYQAVTALYTRSLNMLKTAIGKGS